MSDRVIVANGGRSMEREISLRSGRRAAGALEAIGFEVETVDPDHRFVRYLMERVPAFVFVAMHGRGGEDGTLQDLLEILEIPYTGSDVHASARCLDKHAFKEMLRTEDLMTPPWHSFNREAFTQFGAGETLPALTSQLGFPLVVKPAREGSSLGIKVVQSSDEFVTAVLGAFNYDDRVVIERFVTGRELAVTVLGSADDPQVLPIVEILTDEPYYTFTAHYETGAATLKIADLGPDELEQVQTAAQRAYTLADCRDLARVDIILDSSGPQILEINTVPGLTETGPTPFAADAAGLEFNDLIAELIRRVRSER
ncbi:MAG: D-alanine--D-alanine ligase [Solirubrobacterales bacterium]